MIYDMPPAIVYDIPTNNFSIPSAEVSPEQKNEKQPISVMVFAQKDPEHFFHLWSKTLNAQLIDSKWAGINSQVHSSWVLYVRGESMVKVAFNLENEHLTEDLGLYLTHLSADIHNGRPDSGIRIKINDKVFMDKYVPPSHDWIIDDSFSLAELVKSDILHQGTNTIEIQLHESAQANYWIHRIVIK